MQRPNVRSTLKGEIMIYTPRSSDTNHTNTKINFRGFEISISMDDRCLGGNRPLTRSSLVVYKDDKVVTAHFAGRHDLSHGAILEVEGETLFEVMQAIATENPAKEPERILLAQHPLDPLPESDMYLDMYLEANERP